MDKDDYRPTGKQSHEYAKEAMQWYGWGSPIGLALGIGLVLSSFGFMMWMLSLAGLLD